MNPMPQLEPMLKQLRFPRFFVHQRVRFKLPIYPFPADAASFAETCTAINI